MEKSYRLTVLHYLVGCSAQLTYPIPWMAAGSNLSQINTVAIPNQGRPALIPSHQNIIQEEQ